MQTSPTADEPALRTWSLAATLGELSRKLLVLTLVTLLTAPLWPLYLLCRIFLERPPIIPALSRAVRVLGWLLTERPSAPGLSVAGRIALIMSFFQRLSWIPAQGLAWYLDLLLYGRALREQEIVAPFFEISAARSGSTQLAHYIEDDPAIVAPGMLQTLFPYRWLWQLAPLFSRWTEVVRHHTLRQFPPEFVQRHEMDPFRTDTFEIQFLVFHFGGQLLSLGPRIGALEFAPARTNPGNEALWEGDFVRFIDALGRKVLIGTQGRRLMIKGHFLAVAPTLERRYPDARFLTMLRKPSARIQSAINFHRCHPAEPLCGPAPWPWLTAIALDVEPAYCQAEQAWFSEKGAGHRYVVRFDAYVKDLEGTMQYVYQVCLGQDAVPPHVPRTHAHRKRSDYSVDRSLAQLGIDQAALERQLAAYNAWCITPTPSPAASVSAAPAA